MEIANLQLQLLKALEAGERGAGWGGGFRVHVIGKIVGLFGL